MVKESLDLVRFPTAVCNDGSAGAYYIAEAHARGGVAAAPRVWLIFLQGGGWCWDEASCAARYSNERGLMSSDGFPPTRNASGIFTRDPAFSPFASANKVYIPYCSSDAFVGNVAKGARRGGGAAGWHFRGQDLVAATLQALRTRARKPLDKGHQVYFGGCSAGARGALFNLEYLPDMLPVGVSVYGLIDSALWVDMEPAAAGAVSFRAQTQGVLDMANASGRLGAECARRYGAAADRWKCLFGEYRLPLVRGPVLLSASQYDSFQLLSNLGMGPPYIGGQLAFAELFRRRTAALMQDLNGTAAVFGPACYGHCITEGSLFWTREVAARAGGHVVGNVSLADVVDEWVRGHGDTLQAVEACSGFDCGCCSAVTCDRCNASRFRRVAEIPPSGGSVCSLAKEGLRGTDPTSSPLSNAGGSMEDVVV